METKSLIHRIMEENPNIDKDYAEKMANDLLTDLDECLMPSLNAWAKTGEIADVTVGQ